MAWIWHLCFTNMKQRGLRTFLTVLGVVIGVISIVSLLAIGIGVKEEMMSTVEATGSITEITVHGITEGKRKDKMLTDRKAAGIEEMEYVKEVYPRLTLNAVMRYGRFTGYMQLVGTTEQYLKKVKIGKGTVPSADSIKPELLLGSHAMDMFFNEGTGLSYTEGNKDKKEEKNLAGEMMEVQFDMEQAAESYRFTISGVTKDISYEIYCNMDVLKKYLKRITGGSGIPGQPIDENGNHYNEWIYDGIIVEVEDVEHVEKVVKRLQDMGYQTTNNKEFLDTMQKQFKMVQILLGGIGMIAFIVAVIGIGNTMTTAVYDRINEIGILKVLGCDPDELLYLFLLESGLLGGLGGLIGIMVSYGITEIGINRIAIKLLQLPKGTDLAVIPLWLSAAAFFFAIVLGIFAGYFPAKWAAKLKPIEAVKK